MLYQFYLRKEIIDLISIIGSGGIENNYCWQKTPAKLKQLDSINLSFKQKGLKKVKRIDDYSKISLLASEIARQTTNIQADQSHINLGLITAMKYSPWENTLYFLKRVFNSNFEDKAPSFFPKTVLNYSAGIICAAYNISSYASTITGRMGADLQALELAQILLETNQLDYVEIISGDYLSNDLAAKMNISKGYTSFSAVYLRKSIPTDKNQYLIINSVSSQIWKIEEELTKADFEVYDIDQKADSILKYILQTGKYGKLVFKNAGNVIGRIELGENNDN